VKRWIVSALVAISMFSGFLEIQRGFTMQPPRAVAQGAINYRREMVRLVTAIATRARTRNSQFGIFPQNGSELGAEPGYIRVCTGIAQEDIYYGYLRDGRATPPEVTQELEANLDRFKAGGKLVLTLDYPFRTPNRPSFDSDTCRKIDRAYRRSSTKGYVPYATVRNLNYLVVNPGHEPRANMPPIVNWQQVREWAIQLQPAREQNRPGFLNALGSSNFDLVVLDYSFDGTQAKAFRASEISALKNRLQGKVLAYLSIGEAEDYRWYWQEEWDADHDGQPDPGAPRWLDAENPDWPGNYAVRYWYPGWQQIIFAYLGRILAQGFDGVYLDCVDAYERYEGQSLDAMPESAGDGCGRVGTVIYLPVVLRLERTPISSLCPGSQPPLVTDLNVRQTPPFPEPMARVPFRDPVFGTCLVRVTDRMRDLAPDDTSAGLKNEYSRVQSFNADESRILVRGIDATWYLYDAHTLQPLGQLPFQGSVDPRWDSSNPDLLYFSEETRLMACNVRTGEQALVHDFAADFPGQSLAAVWTRWEGSPSLDGRYWGLMAEDQDWQTVALLVYDQQMDRVIAKRELSNRLELDSVSISPLGNYFLAYCDNYCQPGQLGSDAHPCGLMVYDRNLSNGRGLLRIIGHSDAALDAQGREVLVFQDIDTDYISVLDLASGKVTRLWPIDFSHTAIGLHFSGRAFRRPGWVVVSTHDGDPHAYTWMDDQVFAVELMPGGRVVRLVHTHSLVDETQEHDYWAEPQASANRDLTRVLFTSNWGRSGTGQVEMFMVELPPDWSTQLP